MFVLSDQSIFPFSVISPHVELLSLDARNLVLGWIRFSATCGYTHSVTLDTPMNRAGMPGADFSSWTPCAEVAE